MASTVLAELDRANPNQLPNMAHRALLGSGLALTPRVEKVAVVSHIATLSRPAMALLSVYATVGTATGELDILKRNAAPAAGDVAIDAVGNVVFQATDAVTEAEICYVPLEGELFEDEDIPVTAGGVGTFLASRDGVQLISATLNAPAATPGAKTVVARGTASPGAGEVALLDAGNTIQFVAGEAGSICTATVTYRAFPGIGEGVEDPFGDRLEAEVDLS